MCWIRVIQTQIRTEAVLCRKGKERGKRERRRRGVESGKMWMRWAVWDWRGRRGRQLRVEGRRSGRGREWGPTICSRTLGRGKKSEGNKAQ